MPNPKYRVARAVVSAASATLTLASLIVLCRAQDAPPQPPPGAPAAATSPAPDAPKPETASHRFKNIQVLKDLPADQLMPTMQLFSQSLGVRCGFCHNAAGGRRGFDVDTPKKQTARKMIMMVTELNRNQPALHGKATCFMCHHGAEEPQTQPGPGERREGGPGGQMRPGGPGGPGGPSAGAPASAQRGENEKDDKD